MPAVQACIYPFRCGTFTSRARLVHLVIHRTAGALGGTLRTAIGTGLANAVSARARLLYGVGDTHAEHGGYERVTERATSS